jgi:putative hydrolase of the HAD superfamily
VERTPHLPTALLLDLDDTILSYSAGADDLWRTLCEECGPRLNGCGPAQLLQNLDHVKGWYWSDKERHRRGRLDLQMARREIVRLTFERAGVVNAALADELADAFTSRREEMVVPFPGALDALSRLNARGVRLALITNGRSEFQRAKIERHGLARFFDCILIEGESWPRPVL